MKKLSWFIFINTFAGSVMIFAVVYGFVSFGSEKLIVAQAETTSKHFANVTFNSLYEIMKSGGTKSDLEDFFKSNRDFFKKTAYRVEVYYRTDKFGRDVQNRQGKNIDEVFAKGVEKNIRLKNGVRYLYPLKVRDTCLDCHSEAKLGDVLGVIECEKDFASVIRESRKNIFVLLAFLSPIPLIGAFIIARLINRRIDKSIKNLHSKIEKINKVRDLKNFEMEEINLGFEDFNAFFGELRQISQKLRDMTIDKEVMSFQVKLLEALIISSEAVKDWRLHVKHIMAEMNKILKFNFIFAVFLDKNENYRFEVFWSNEPGQNKRAFFNRKIKEICAPLHFASTNTLNIIHNVVFRNVDSLELSEEEIECRGKTLFFNVPRVGGIIGIGVNLASTTDCDKYFVVESVLPSLLNAIGTVRAIDRYTAKLKHFAARDPLTQLYNQRVFWELLEGEIERAKKYDYKFSLVVMDMDNFKTINDTYGHGFGDILLQEFSQLLKNLRKSGDIIARYGGDEFVACISTADNSSLAPGLPKKIKALSEFSIRTPEGVKIRITSSIGIAVYPDHALDSRELFLLADNMMYRAKSLGKGRVCIPRDEDMAEVFKSIAEKNILILKAIDEGKVVPNFQPIMKVENKSIEAYEFLMRIELSDRLMAAGEFIDDATDMGVIDKMDSILMDKIFEKVREDNYCGYIFLNQSPKALLLDEFIVNVERLVEKYKISPDKVVFEITERDTVKNLSVIENNIHKLKSQGFKFAIDDFGSGFSSFQYIRWFPVDFIKIEGEFVRAMIRDEIYRAMVLSIVTLARELGIKTVAEYVESEKVFDAVKAAGIDYVQGYYIGKPSESLKISEKVMKGKRNE